MKLTSAPTDERRTPRWLFKLCDRLFGPFDLDCFAAKWNHQVPRFITREQDYFRSRLKAKCAWHQPPYSRGFLPTVMPEARARVLSGQYQRAVCLIPADTSSKYWKRAVKRPEGRVLEMRSLWNHYPKPFTDAYQLVSEGLLVTVVEVEGRVPFDSPQGAICDGAGAMQPSAVVVFEKPQTSAQRRAA